MWSVVRPISVSSRRGGTNLKVGEGRRKNFVVPLHFFDSKITISRLGERFRDGQYSLISFLFAVLLLTVPLFQAICKSERRVCPRPPPVSHGVGATGRKGGAQQNVTARGSECLWFNVPPDTY